MQYIRELRSSFTSTAWKTERELIGRSIDLAAFYMREAMQGLQFPLEQEKLPDQTAEPIKEVLQVTHDLRASSVFRIQPHLRTCSKYIARPSRS